MIIKTWQERMAACATQRHHDFCACMMQAEIDELRSALAAKLVPMPDMEIEDATQCIGMNSPLARWAIARAIEAHHGIGKQEPTDCQCRQCLRDRNERSGLFKAEMTRMILCQKCGNKRCPHATDHRHACTNSNEPGQVGSSYEHCKQEPTDWATS